MVVKFKDAAMLDVANCAGLMTESVLAEGEDEKKTNDLNAKSGEKVLDIVVVVLCQVQDLVPITSASLTRLLSGCVWPAGRESIQ